MFGIVSELMGFLWMGVKVLEGEDATTNPHNHQCSPRPYTSPSEVVPRTGVILETTLVLLLQEAIASRHSRYLGRV